MMPEWTEDIFHTYHLAFESAGVKQHLWGEFKKEFPPDQFNQDYLPSYFQAYVNTLCKSGEIDFIRRDVAARGVQRLPQLSQMEIMEQKFENYFRERAHRGDVVEFTVKVQCPYCKEVTQIDSIAYEKRLYECVGCDEFVKL